MTQMTHDPWLQERDSKVNSHLSQGFILCALLLAVALVPAGCIDQVADETGQANQGLIEYEDGYEGGYDSGSYPIEDTYNYADFDDTYSPVQNDVTTEPMQQVIIVGTRLPQDPQIEGLGLSPEVKEIAYDLKDSYPTIRFTSGRRNPAGQVRAMAKNVAQKSQWIAQTYRNTPLRNALQQWVDSHPGSTRAQIEAGLSAIFAAAPPADVASFSKHFSGDAFDVAPVSGALGDAIHTDLSNLPGRFLDHEGGLRRWHYQR
jgi:hypothetical protein